MLNRCGQIEKNPADSMLVKSFKVDENLSGKAIALNTLKKIFTTITEIEYSLTRTRSGHPQLLVYGGLRRSEVANIHWKDLFKEGVFNVLALPETKSGTGQEIKLQDSVVHYLEEYREVLEKEGYSTEGAVFISLARNRSHGQQLTDQSINLIMKKHALKSGVDVNITAHMFRHTLLHTCH